MQRKEVALHLISELCNYVLDADPVRVVVSLHQEEDGMHLAVLDDTVRDDAEMERIRTQLNNPRRPELAAYYGGMAGTDMIGHARLNLIGWQVKHGEVSRTDKGTKIDVWLGGERFEPARFTIPDGAGEPGSNA